MPENLKKLLKFAGVAVIAIALLSVLNGIAGLANIAERFVVGSWVYVFAALVGAIGVVIAYPIWQVMKLPRAPLPTQETSGPAFDGYQAWLAQHLKNHSDTEVSLLALRDGIEPALAKLNSKADALVYATASQVFIETALSQNGRLDGLLMLARHVKLVWSVAKLYELQPSPERLWYLYSNVAMASVLSTSLENMDLDEMVKPLVAAVLPAAVGAIPGLQTISSIVVGSLMDGTANALLTLRLGGLTKQYALPLQRPSPASARMQASTQAYAMLSQLTRDNVGKVVRIFGDVAKSAFQASAGKLLSGVSKGASVTVDGIASAATFAGEKLSVAGEKTADAVGQTARAVTDVSRKAADQTLKASSYVAGKVVEAASSTGDALGNAGHAMRGAVIDGSEIVSQTAKVTAAAVKEASVGVGRKVSSVTRTAASEVAEVGNTTADKIGAGLSSLRSTVGKPFAGDSST